MQFQCTTQSIAQNIQVIDKNRLKYTNLVRLVEKNASACQTRGASEQEYVQVFKSAKKTDYSTMSDPFAEIIFTVSLS